MMKILLLHAKRIYDQEQKYRNKNFAIEYITLCLEKYQFQLNDDQIAPTWSLTYTLLHICVQIHTDI